MLPLHRLPDRLDHHASGVGLRWDPTGPGAVIPTAEAFSRHNANRCLRFGFPIQTG